MDIPLVSVLMATRDENSDYLRDAVESIRCQSYPHWEFLICDDGSESIENYEWLLTQSKEDRRIHVWRAEHRGLAVSLNMLLAKAQGDFFARMDSDDRAYPERLHKEVEYLLRYSDTVLVGSWIRIINNEGKEIHVSGRPDYIKRPWSRSAHSTWCGRIDALRAIGGYCEAYPVSQDYDCWLRIQQQGRVGVIEEVLLDYRWGRISSTRSFDQIRYYHIANEMQRRRSQGKTANIDEIEKIFSNKSTKLSNRIRAQSKAQVAMQAWQQGKYTDACRQYIASLRSNPFAFSIWLFLFWILLFKEYPAKLIPLLRMRLYKRQLLYVNSYYQQRAVCICEKDQQTVHAKITIIIPTFNRSQALARLLQSLMEQYEYIKHIIIVDGSPEPVESIIPAYEKLEITYVQSCCASLTYQRNVGVKHLPIDTKLVCFFDDDIVLRKNALKNMIAYWNEAGAEVGGAAFNIVSEVRRQPSVFKKIFLTSADEKGKVLRSGFASMLSPVDQNYFTDWIFGGATVWRKDILDTYRFDEWFQGYGYAEDLCFSYEVGRKYKLAVVKNAEVLHEKDDAEPAKHFRFGFMQVVNRGYFVCTHKEFSKILFIWALIGQWAENMYMFIVRMRMRFLLRACGNVVGVFLMPCVIWRKRCE